MDRLGRGDLVAAGRRIRTMVGGKPCSQSTVESSVVQGAIPRLSSGKENPDTVRLVIRMLV